ncbi:MAG: hypothetical protein IJ906_09065 [Oscillospiraceae bacterium]|nr:hypothetical protein [Oscillospiraceae bacterium]
MLNVSSRQVTDAELLKSYEVLDKIFQEKKNSIGKKFGRVREKLAEMLGVSTGQISKIQNIVHNAVPPVVKAVQDGELSLSAANEIAKMDTVSQIATVQNGVGKCRFTGNQGKADQACYKWQEDQREETAEKCVP